MKAFRSIFLYIIFFLLLLAFLPLLLVEKEKKPALNSSAVIKVLLKEGNIKEIGLEDFLVGVLAGEMPASFPLEALEAQAIAARTYIYQNSSLSPNGKPRHENCDICCDPQHCQNWYPSQELENKWGSTSRQYIEKLTQAVAATQGEILTYQGQPIDTPYFSTCGGKTENCEDVWGTAKPWLISVACPWDKTAPKYQSQENFSLKQAAELLSVEPQALTAMKLISQTPGGRVGELQIGDKKLAGVDIRRQLGLNSAAFTWQAERDKISFSVLGYGHGVGMCQYGARGMALKGYTYQEILAHYYQGTKIEKIY